MIVLASSLLKDITDAAEAAYPHECCGLLIGRNKGLEIRISRIAASPNNTRTATKDSFEIDPQLRFDLMRELEGGDERIVGHYHSHPDHPAQPSARDLDSAWEPDLAWLIVSVIDAQAVHTTAHAVDAAGRQFRQIPLRTDDWIPYPWREKP